MNFRFQSAIEDILNSAVINQTIKNNQKVGKVEKLFSQPKELFECVDFTELGVVSENNAPKFIEGADYELSGVACDGFNMESKTYRLVKVVDTFNGYDINSVIVKQISGPKGTIFALSKNDCLCHGIEYERGLQLFPQTLSWKRVKKTIPFDKHNLATTPLSDIDNTIRNVVIKLNGFKDYADGHILTPSGHLITEKQFEDSIRVINNEPIVYGNGYIVAEKTPLKISIVYPNTHLYNHANFISSEDTIFIMIHLMKTVKNLTYRKAGVKADYDSFGVDPKYLDGINPNDFFTISWDELGAYTVEEYNKKKEEERKRQEELIRKKEEEQRRKIEEEERKIREKREKAETIAKKLRENKLQMPKYEPSEYDGSIDSMVEYVSTVNAYIYNVYERINGINQCIHYKVNVAV